MSEQVTPDRIIGLGNAWMTSGALRAAIELGVFSELARGLSDGETLRQRLGLHPRLARDFFDALVALGLLDRAGDQYSNVPDVDLFLDTAKPTYLGMWFSGLAGGAYERWVSLPEFLRTGQSLDLYTPNYPDETAVRHRLEGMTSIHTLATRTVARTFPFGRYQTFVDVGANLGGLAVQVALAHPHITGGGFDLPPVQPHFEEYVASFGLSDRLRFYPGDFLRDPLPPADVLALGHVLMDWRAEERRMLIAKAYEALPRGGALLAYEVFIDDDRRRNAHGLLLSVFVQLLSDTAGGEYTDAQCRAWMHDAGFRETYVESLGLCALGPESMVVGIK